MSPNNFNIAISPKGEITMVYSDDHRGFLDKLDSPVVIERASFVEPQGEEWTADMSPIEPGVVLGPFKLRSEALAAEQTWLNQKLFGA